MDSRLRDFLKGADFSLTMGKLIDPEDRKPSEVVTYTLSKEELEQITKKIKKQEKFQYVERGFRKK